MDRILSETQPYLVSLTTNAKVFINKSKFSIGRAVANSHVIEELQISRTHCVIEEKGGKWYLIDVSMNGTNVGNKKIAPNVPYELTTGDVIQLCDAHRFAFVNMNEYSLDDLTFTPPLEEHAVPLAVEELEVRTTNLDEQTNIDYVRDSVRQIMPEPSSYHTYCKKQNDVVQDDVPASDLNRNNSTSHTQNDSTTIEFEATARFRRILDEPRCINPGNESQRLNRHTNYRTYSLLDPTIEELMAERMHAPVTEEEKGSVVETKVSEPAPSSSATFEQMEDELQCSICTELFIKATTLNCSHSFCKHCLEEWRKKSNKCPICRSKITTANPTIVLDNFITKVLETASEEVKQKRAEIIKDREKPENDAPTKPTRPQRNTRSVQRIRIGPPIEISSDEDCSDEEDDEFMDYTDSDEAEYNGVPGVYYGGYGHCYSCGERGHWANGCPYR